MVGAAQDFSVSDFLHRLGHSESLFLLTASDFSKTCFSNAGGSYDPGDVRLRVQSSKKSKISKKQQKNKI